MLVPMLMSIHMFTHMSIHMFTHMSIHTPKPYPSSDPPAHIHYSAALDCASYRLGCMSAAYCPVYCMPACMCNL